MAIDFAHSAQITASYGVMMANNGRRHTVPFWFNGVKRADGDWDYTTGPTVVSVTRTSIDEPYVPPIPEIEPVWIADPSQPSGWRLQGGTGIPEVPAIPEKPLTFSVTLNEPLPSTEFLQVFFGFSSGMNPGADPARAGKIVPAGTLQVINTTTANVVFYRSAILEDLEFGQAYSIGKIHVRVCYKSEFEG